MNHLIITLSAQLPGRGKLVAVSLPKLLSRQEIIAGIDVVRSDVSACLSVAPRTSIISVRMEIAGEGRMRSVQAVEGPRELVDLVCQVLMKASFPQTQEGACFEHSFAFGEFGAEDRNAQSVIDVTLVGDESDHGAHVAEVVQCKYCGPIQRRHLQLQLQDEHIRGQIGIVLSIGPKGNVLKSSVRAFHPALREIIEQHIGKWRFRPQHFGVEQLTREYELELQLGLRW